MNESRAIRLKRAPRTAPLDSARVEGVWRATVRRFVRHRLALIGFSTIVLFATASALAPWIAPYSFHAIDLDSLFKPPSTEHWLGTSDVGHDVFTRILFAGRVSLTVGLVSSLVSVSVGTVVGLVAGYFAGWWDRVLMRVVDMLLAIPTIALMFVLARVLGPGIGSIVVVLVLLGWMGTARLVRAEVLRLKRLEYVEAARSVGVSDGRIILRHVLPNGLAPVIVSASLQVGAAILAESTISYFGLGIQPPVPSWGNMLQNAQGYLWTAPWLAIYPGVFIFATVLSFNFLGDGLRDALDPRQQR
jgi:peptide/nickel transport system permease protein